MSSFVRRPRFDEPDGSGGTMDAGRRTTSPQLFLQSPLQKLQFSGEKSQYLWVFSLGMPFAKGRGMEVVKKFATEGVMGVLGHPFLPYVAVLFALLRSL